MESRPPALVRFGVFEVDLNARELRKQGLRLKLQEQPFRILTALLERPGEVVTREELRAQIWAEDTFVDFDKSLNTSVNKLREALGDSADTPRFIETLPRRGYRFVAPLTKETKGESEGATEERPAWRQKFIVAVIFSVVTALAIGLVWRGSRSRRLTEKDSIVLADFVNTTGDAVFDDALKQGLRAQLEQSTLLNILSDEQATEELSLMGQPKDVRLTKELAREVCLRAGSKAMLTGSISALGRNYVIGLAALDCQNGESLGDEQAEADSRERVLQAVDQAARKMRNKLGESLASVQRYGVPIVRATTPSLEALRAYSLGMKMFAATGDAAALPFFQRAVEIDPKFAMAYARIANSHANLGESTLSAENLRRAYELTQNVSERERLYIESHYYDIVTGELEKSARVLELYKDIYPRESFGHNNLATVFFFSGRLTEALQEGRQAVLLTPEYEDNYATLGRVYIALNRLDDAEALLKQAEDRKLEGENLLWCRYQVAFLRHNLPEIDRLVRIVGSKQGLRDLVGIEGLREAQRGRLKHARELWRQAEESAAKNGGTERLAVYQAAAGLIEAYLGESERARASVEAALKTGVNRDSEPVSALALALADDVVGAEILSTDLNQKWPLDTTIQRYWLPTVRAAIALVRQNPEQAIESVQAMGALELCPEGQLDPVYLRGRAYLDQGNSKMAAAEFQKILEHPGSVLESPVGALAYLGLARSYALQGNRPESRAAYQHFIALWKDADPDIPVLRQTQREYAKLQ